MPNWKETQDALPELTPEMLCSYGGMRELEGARAMQRRPTPQSHDDQVDAVMHSIAASIPPDDEISFDNDYNLDSELGGGGGSSGGVEVRSFRAPAQGERFNVLRPPQREPFRPPPPMPGPQGGPMREVGRVGAFAILSDADQEGPRDYVAEARARLEDRVTAEARRFENPARSPRTSTRTTVAQVRQQRSDEFSAKQLEQRAAIHETLPTAYDRLLGDDQFEDDLE